MKKSTKAFVLATLSLAIAIVAIAIAATITTEDLQAAEFSYALYLTAILVSGFNALCALLMGLMYIAAEDMEEKRASFSAIFGFNPPAEEQHDRQSMKSYGYIVADILSKKAENLRRLYDEEDSFLKPKELTPVAVEVILQSDEALTFRDQVVRAKADWDKACQLAKRFGFNAPSDPEKHLLTKKTNEKNHRR